MRNLSCIAVLLTTTSLFAQAPPRALPASRDRAITFSDAKPVLGLPLDAKRTQGICSADGLTYFAASANTSGAARALELYSVATSGDVRHLRQSVPFEYTNVSARDFFPGDAALVTLIAAEIRDGGDPDGRLQEQKYYLAVSDHDGDGSKLLALNLPFKPLKVAQFGTGEFVVLGWESGNEQEKLAVLKEDGTLLRFFDLDQRQKERRTEPATLTSLAGAAFVPFGRGILLTYPGTVKPIRELSASGRDFPISLEFPAGYLLHDVLNSGGPSTVVARVQELAESETAGKGEDSTPSRQRLFEFQWPTGKRIREFTFDIPVSAVTCAGNRSLGAVFLQPATTPADSATDVPSTQLVVATIRR